MKLKTVITIIFSVLLILLISNVVYAGELNLSQLQYDVKLNSNGSADIVEKWEIKIEDTNTLFKTFEVDKEKYTAIIDVKVEEILPNGLRKEFKKINQEMYHVTKGSYYALINKDGDFEIAWGVDVQEQTKTYEISYTVKDIVKTYNDCSELYWQFISNNSAIPVDLVTGTIKLPKEVENRENLRVWAHGPLNGDIWIDSNDTVKFKVEYLNANTYVEARVVTLENNMYSNNLNRINTNKFNSILNEETALAQEANYQREIYKEQIEKQKQINRITMTAIVIIQVIIIIILITKIIKYSKINKTTKKIEPTNKVQYFRELPNEKTTPAEAAFIYYFNKSTTLNSNISQILSATMLDLCMKKYIQFDVEKNGKKDDIKITILENNDKENLKQHEKNIMEILEKAVAKKEEKTFTMKEFQKYIKKNSTSFITSLDKIEKQVKEEQEKEGNYSPEIIKKGSKWSLNIAKYIILLIIGLPIMMYVFLVDNSIINTNIYRIIRLIGRLSFILIIMLDIINIIYCSLIRKKFHTLTQKGEDEKELWCGLKRYMEDFSLLDEKEIPQLVIWEKYLVYATAFGIADKVLEQLKIKYPQITDEAYFNTHQTAFMYLMYNNTLNTAFLTSFNNSITKAYDTGVSQRAIQNGYSYGNSSSGGGFGGGFSGGGGFGGGRRRPEAQWEEDR